MESMVGMKFGTVLGTTQTGKQVVGIAKRDWSSTLPKYEIKNIVDQYHSGLEHTFLWIIDAQDPHKIQVCS